MFIKKINLKNFTVFNELSLDFCEGINILVGKNGTGKTHILKALYGVLDIFNNKGINQNKNKGNINYGGYIADYFQASEKDNSLLVIDSSKESLISLTTRAYDIKFQVYYKDLNTNTFVNNPQVNTKNKNHANINSLLFIPAKEMLSHSKGLLALEREREIPFDKTLIDIVAKSHLGEKKETSTLQKEILDVITNVIDGEVTFKDDTFYIVKKNGLKIEFSLEAEGLRKFALLWRLVRNGTIDKNTILFWDEPESNINPQLVPILVEILFKFARNGIQIFIATHDYNLAKYFEVKREDSDCVLYHCLYKSEDTVDVASNKYFGKLINNPIIDADEKLLDEVFEKNLWDATD